MQESYEYDALGQLVWVYSPVVGTAVEQVYDLGGNLTEKKTYAYGLDEEGELALGALTGHVRYNYTDTVWKDLLISRTDMLSGTTTPAITYDAIGNPSTWVDGKSFVWQNGRQLSSVTQGGTTTAFTYNADGLRISKDTGDVTYRYNYDGSTLLQQKWGNTSLLFLTDASGQYYAMMKNGILYYYVHNAQGDVIGILDGDGDYVARYSYDAWGAPVRVTDGDGVDVRGNAGHIANMNPIRYRGYYWDGETGLYYLQTRYYDPAVGRFVNADGLVSTGQGVLGSNMFVYCGNGPVNRVDPTGNAYVDAAKYIKDNPYPMFDDDPSRSARMTYRARQRYYAALEAWWEGYEKAWAVPFKVAPVEGRTDQGITYDGHGPARDLPSPAGTPIYAAMTGIVTNVVDSYPNSYNTYPDGPRVGGNYIEITVAWDGAIITYAHMLQNIEVTKGQYVETGTLLGYVGSTGFSQKAHLHFSVRKFGKYGTSIFDYFYWE